jgi:HlyD family secretion protein
MAQKLETAQAQLSQAMESLLAANRKESASRQRLDQARSALLSVQSRAAVGDQEVRTAREKLAAAESAYRANPSEASAQRAHDEALSAYRALLQRSAVGLKQTAADLSQAYEGVRAADEELAVAGSADPSALDAARRQVEGARLSLAVVQREAELGGTLSAQTYASEVQLSALRTQLKGLHSQMEAAVLKAPVAGTVLKRYVQDGQPVPQNQPLMTLADLKQMMIRIRVDELDIPRVSLGQSLRVRTSAFGTEGFKGKVSGVAAQGTTDPKTGGIMFEVMGIVENPAHRLRSGMSGQARIEAETRSGVLVVGVESVREEGETASILVVHDHKIQVRPVRLGLRTQTQVEILEGLEAGEQVVVSPFTLIRDLKDGALVHTEVIDPPNRGDEE